MSARWWCGTLAGGRSSSVASKALKQVADHTTEIIHALDNKPAVMGHSTGGLVAQMLAGQGLSAATVAIDPGVFRGVLPLPAPVLKGLGPFLVNPLTRGRAIKLQRRNPGVTEIVKIPNRGHSLTIDHGWREVAQTTLDFLNRFA